MREKDFDPRLSNTYAEIKKQFQQLMEGDVVQPEHFQGLSGRYAPVQEHISIFMLLYKKTLVNIYSQSEEGKRDGNAAEKNKKCGLIIKMFRR